MTKNKPKDVIKAGELAYQEWQEELWTDPEYCKLYAEEAAKSELWLQLVEARKAARLTQQRLAERIGVSQAQVARIEKEDYDSYTLNTLRKYVAALGEGFALEVTIHIPESSDPAESMEIS